MFAGLVVVSAIVVVCLIILQPWLSETGLILEVCGSQTIGSTSITQNCGIIEGTLTIDVDGDVDIGYYFPRLRNISSSIIASGVTNLASVTFKASNDKVIIGEGIVFSENPRLQLVDLPSTETVGHLRFEDNNMLDKVNLPTLTTVEEDIEFIRNEHIEEFDLPEVRFIGGGIYFENNELLADVRLPKVQVIDGTVTFQGNPELTTTNFTSVEKIGSLDIRNNGNLTDIDLAALLSVQDYIQFEGNSALETVTLAEVPDVGSFIMLRDNTVLKKVCFPLLREIGEDLEINNNDELTSIKIPSLSDIKGNVTIMDNDALVTIQLLLVQQIGGSVLFDTNDMLTEIDFPIVESIGGLIVENHALLQSVSFTQLDIIDGPLRFLDNVGLQINFDVPLLNFVAGEIDFIGNENLTRCDRNQYALYNPKY